jgi:hypothetical protein
MNTEKIEQQSVKSEEFPTGFVAGTQISIDWYTSTPNAFNKAIEQLALGDMVQCIPKDGTDKITKRVVRITTSEQPIWYVSFYTLENVKEYSLGGCRYVGVTANHLFLVTGRCIAGRDIEYACGADLCGTPENYEAYPQPVWKRADQLQFNDVMQCSKSEKLIAVALAKPMYQYDPEQPNLAWMHGLGDDEGLELGPSHDNGLLFDLSKIEYFGEFECLYGETTHPLWDVDGEGIDEPDHHFIPYCTTVYNIEVEDCHTYLLSSSGVAVCDHATGL